MTDITEFAANAPSRRREARPTIRDAFFLMCLRRVLAIVLSASHGGVVRELTLVKKLPAN